MAEANPDDIVNTIRTMIRSNRVLMFGRAPTPEVAKALGMEVIQLHGSWTLMNEKRPEYVPLTVGSYLVSARRVLKNGEHIAVSRNVYLRYVFRKARNRALEAASPSEKSLVGWYPWLRSATPAPTVQ